MTPTPAQIEAAAKAINNYEKSQGTLLYDDDWFLGHAKAALTAAAEVGPQMTERSEIYWCAVNATIERCAQVAESTTYMSGAHIAAAIRALKDKS